MKKKFILFLGRSWSGTTSLYWTLQNNNIMHGGFFKESNYLCKIDVDKNGNDVEKNNDSITQDAVNFLTLYGYEELLHRRALFFQKLYENNVNLSDPYSELPFDSNPPISKKDRQDCRIKISPAINSFVQPLKKFSSNDIDYYFKDKFTVDKYVEYYVKLAEHCGEDFQFVGDFSNRNFFLSHETLIEVKSKLEQYFDVKVMIMFRDPIRRHFSTYCALTNNKYFEPIYGEYDLELFKKKFFTNNSWVTYIKNLYSIFGEQNVHYMIMEDFFKEEENNLEVKKLEYFLDAKISKIFPCCFVPDKGINAPKIVGLEDQWNSDHEKLPKEVYEELRFRDDFFKIYEEFRSFHGSLPADWGCPINYGY